MNNSGKGEKITLTILFENKQLEIFFSQRGRKYKELHLWSREEDEFFVHPNDPFPETLSAWAQLVITELKGLSKSFDLLIKGNGLRQSEKEKLDAIVEQFREAIIAQVNTSIDCTDIFDSTDWDATLQ